MIGGLLLDVDGTVVDSVPELYATTAEAWENECDVAFPMDYPTFAALRPHITKMIDYFRLIKDELSGTRYSEEVLEPECLNDAFYTMRDVRMKRDKATWLAENTLYPGIKDALKEVSELGILMAVVSSKNKEAIIELFNYHGLVDFVGDRIIGKDEADGRVNQFRMALEDYHMEPGRTVVYDDAKKNLVVAADLGMIPIGAPQGYALEGDLNEFICATPEEFGNTMRRIFCSE